MIKPYKNYVPILVIAGFAAVVTIGSLFGVDLVDTYYYRVVGRLVCDGIVPTDSVMAARWLSFVANGTIIRIFGDNVLFTKLFASLLHVIVFAIVVMISVTHTRKKRGIEFYVLISAILLGVLVINRITYILSQDELVMLPLYGLVAVLCGIRSGRGIILSGILMGIVVLVRFPSVVVAVCLIIVLVKRDTHTRYAYTKMFMAALLVVMLAVFTAYTTGLGAELLKDGPQRIRFGANSYNWQMLTEYYEHLKVLLISLLVTLAVKYVAIKIDRASRYIALTVSVFIYCLFTWKFGIWTHQAYNIKYSLVVSGTLLGLVLPLDATQAVRMKRELLILAIFTFLLPLGSNTGLVKSYFSWYLYIPIIATVFQPLDMDAEKSVATTELWVVLSILSILGVASVNLRSVGVYGERLVWRDLALSEDVVGTVFTKSNRIVVINRILFDIKDIDAKYIISSGGIGCSIQEYSGRIPLVNSIWYDWSEKQEVVEAILDKSKDGVLFVETFDENDLARWPSATIGARSAVPVYINILLIKEDDYYRIWLFTVSDR